MAACAAWSPSFNRNLSYDKPIHNLNPKSMLSGIVSGPAASPTRSQPSSRYPTSSSSSGWRIWTMPALLLRSVMIHDEQSMRQLHLTIHHTKMSLNDPDSALRNLNGMMIQPNIASNSSEIATTVFDEITYREGNNCLTLLVLLLPLLSLCIETKINAWNNLQNS